MRRPIRLVLKVTAGLVFVACAADTLTGTRSDGVTVMCANGEDYYVCLPQFDGPSRVTNPNPGDGSGSGSGDGSGDGSGSGSGSGSDGSGGGSGSGDTGCGPDTYPCDGDGGGSGGGSGCTPWPNGAANVLWPPNHKLITFTLDDCAAAETCPAGHAGALDGTITKITVDEAVDVGQGGDGHTTKFDVAILDARTFQLRSERQGGADGRVYTVYYNDAAGNAGSCQFLVPHNQGPYEGAVDSGTVVTVLP